jgi:hypothetical protein
VQASRRAWRRPRGPSDVKTDGVDDRPGAGDGSRY